jgi:1-acyl-sn-glycerol-3-phosphate acyltransferase
MTQRMNDGLADELARISAAEMVAALGVRGAPSWVRRGLSLPFLVASQPLGSTLAAFDSAVTTHGIADAARRALGDFRVQLEVRRPQAPEGPCLVLANHPGAYDALSLMSAVGRDDLLILAADREFLRALPRLSRHLLPVGERPEQRARTLRRARHHLLRGGAVLHFPAGAIEPDADFEPKKSRWLGPWQPGASALVAGCARAGGHVMLAGVRGVHSPRAKRAWLNRLAEERGITTLSPLLQLVGKLADVRTRVCLEPGGAATALAELPIEAQEQTLRRVLERAIESAAKI